MNTKLQNQLFSIKPHLWLLLALIILALLPGATAEAADSTESGLTISQSNTSGLHFQLNSAPLQVSPDGRILAPGLDQTIQDPGAPALPYFSTLIALPPQAEVSLSLSASGLSRLEQQVQPVPQQRLQGQSDPQGMMAADPAALSESLPIQVQDQDIYGQDAPFPQQRYRLSEVMYLRDLRLVQLDLFPITYNPQQRTLTQAASLDVRLTFSGAQFHNLNPAPGLVDSQDPAWRARILNFDQAQDWRSLPPSRPQAPTADLPIGGDTFKILVDQDGIYEISGAELAAKGMSLPVNPASIEMMHAGLPVAFQFIDGNSNNQFDSPDTIRFFGWAFDGSRYEQMYVADNVFWLWAGGSAATIPQVANEAGSGQVVTTFQETVTRHEENDNFSGWAVEWQNEPTLWHWDLISAASGQTASKTYEIDLPDPDPAANGNQVTVELTTKLNPFVINIPLYNAKTVLNGSTTFGEATWQARDNFNLTQEFPASDFKEESDPGYPTNEVQVSLTNLNGGAATVQLTSITVDYTRTLKAVNDQIIFSNDQAGTHDFQISGFSQNDPDSLLAWDISDPRLPQQIAVEAQNLSGPSGDYTLAVGRTHGQDGRFITTNTSNIQPVKAIEYYQPVSLVPTDSEAQWLAITHSSLSTAADTLATHRSADFSTFVVDIEDVTNQIGYGFHTPHTIRDYLSQALNQWAVPPQYVVLFGDATRNPLNLDCPLCSGWDKDAPNLIATDFAFVDRWNGMVPSDFSMTLLAGDDLIAEMTIGRFPANTLAEAEDMVDKVIQHETLRQGALQDWQKHVLFVADNTDNGGNFCHENDLTGQLIPSPDFQQTHLCLPINSVAETDALRAEMSNQVNNVGVSVLNYRGHGSTTTWASGPAILTSANTAFWQNNDRPLFILSADCLDGYFINTHSAGLGENFMRLENRGSTAHWSSSGFGFSSEHTVLHSSFYEGLFDYYKYRIGDAIQYSKVQYKLSGYFSSELYSFILLGDPAMFLFQPQPDTQEIQLEAGWNMISSYISPDDLQIEHVLRTITEQTEIVKNNIGQVYWPGFSINTIGNWNPLSGYQIYLNEPVTLVIGGSKIDPLSTPINLDPGFNLVSYLRDNPMPADQALVSINSELVIVKDGYGRNYWPGLGINTIGSLQPGQGYQIYVNNGIALVYPAND